MKLNVQTGLGCSLLIASGLSGCMGPAPLKGGRASSTGGPRGSLQQQLAQGDNPAQPSKQDQEIIKVRTYTVPAGSHWEQLEPFDGAPGALSERSNLAPLSIVLSAPMPVVEREEARAGTQLGASQKDTARELGAKLTGLRPVTWVGIALFVLGLASLVWPPLKALIGSVTTSAAIAAGGLALIILPTIIVGNELLILGGVVLSAGAWFLAHRHGQLRGQLSQAPNNAPFTIHNS
jgi:hypothetical protein